MGNSKYYKELNALAVVDRSVKVQLRQDKRQLYYLCLYATLLESVFLLPSLYIIW